jgi:hypothetical protein
MAKFNIVSKKTASTKALERLLNKTKDEDKDVITYDPTKQAEGLKQRIEGSGLDAEKFTDTRNPIERALNLTPNQNFLFDVFEIINRPQQAVFNAVKASQDGKEVGKAMLEGFSGKAEDVYFKDILNNAGITEDSGDAFGADDVIGFVGDIFLDPIDVALIAAAPFTGGATAAIAFADNANDSIKALKGSIEVYEGIIKAGSRSADNIAAIKKLIAKKTKQLDKLQKNVQHYGTLKKAAENVLEVSKAGSKYDVSMAKKAYKQALKPLMIKKTPLEMAMRGSKWTIGKSFGATDNVITRILQKTDAQKGATGIKYENGWDAVNKEFSSSQKYINFKDKVSSIFKASQSIPKNLITKIKGKGQLSQEQILLLGDDVVKVVKDLAVKSGKSEVETSKILQDIIEFKLKPKIKANDILRDPSRMMDDATRLKMADLFEKQLGITRAQFDELVDVVDLGDGVTGYRFKPEALSENSTIQKDIAKLIEEQNNAHKVVQTEVDKINKRMDKANNVDETTYDIVDGKLVWSRADDVTQKKAESILDQDIISKNIPESGKLDTNESINNAAKQQRKVQDKKIKKLRDEVEVIKGKLKLLRKDGVFETSIDAVRNTLKKKIGELDIEIKKIKEIDNLILDTEKAIKKTKNILDPKINPDKYSGRLKQIETEKTGKYLEVELDKELDGPKFYSAEETKSIKSMMADPEVMRAVQEVEGKMNRMYEVLDEILGTNFVSRSEAGYVRHTATPDAQRFFAENIVDSNPKLKGRTSSFKDRGYRMSAKEANRLWNEVMDRTIKLASPEDAAKLQKYKGTKLFEEELTKSIADFVQEASDIGVVSKIFDDLALRGTFDDPELFQLKTEGTVQKARQRVVSKKQLIKKLEAIAEYRGVSTNITETIKRLEKFQDGSNFYMDNTLLELIGAAPDPEIGNIFLQVVNGLNNIFKKFSLATPGFHLRNVLGNYTNMFLSGVNMGKLNGYMEEAYVAISKGKEVLAKVARQGEDSLTAAEKVIFKDYKQFVQSGFHDVAYELYDLPKMANKGFKGKDQKQNAINWVLQKNMDANKYMDNMFRMGLLKYANDNPDVYLKAGKSSPEDFVRMVLFDPNDLTVAEKKWLRSMIPFYTFMKKNLAYQMKNVFENPSRYNEVNKAIKSAWNNIGVDRDEIEPYKKENFWIPLLKKENGEYISIKANLPIGDLGEFISDPLQKIISSVTPAVRAPFEITANTQTYTGLPIQEFKGQQGFRIPELGRGVEYGLSQFGLLNPAGMVYDIVNPNARKEAGVENFFNAVSFTSTGDAAREQRNRGFQELQRLRDAVSYYKQQGKEIKTLEEIRSDVSLNKTTTAQILARLQSTLK